MKRSAVLPVALLAAALAAVQIVATALGREYILTQMIMAAYYSIVVLGLCLLMGYAGQVSLGHAAFFAIGGYTSAVLTTKPWPRGGAAADWLARAGVLAERADLYGEPLTTVAPWAAFGAALLLAAAVALLVGYPALRLRGYTLAMATLGFGLIVYRLALGAGFTGSADGISGVPPWRLGFGLAVCGDKARRVQNYYVAWSLAVLALLGLLNIVQSRFGRGLRAIHDGELAANAMGVDTGRAKLQVFVLSAVLAAAAGSFLTHYNGGIGPSEAGAMKSVRYVALVAAGGMANLWGALTVSAVLTFLSLRGCFGTFDHAVFGLILIGIVALAPEGPLRPLAAWFRRAASKAFRGRSPHAPA